MTQRFILILAILFSAQIISAQEDDKPITAIKQQEIFLDSMMNIRQIKNKKLTKNYTNIPDSLLKNIPDSVYIKRLKNVNSAMQVSYNEYVRNWIELYIKRNRRTPFLIGLSSYYFPIFEEILDKYQLPLELKYLPIIESALNPQARSRAGATGLWQFMYSTGKMYGLEINSYIDERKDVLKSTHAAAHFLKDMYEMYGDWILVIAGYNCGPGNVNKAIRRAGGKTNFWQIYPYLPRETRGYVPAFISALYTMNYYKKHNIKPVKIDMNIFTDTVMIDKKLHLMQVAEVLKIPFDEITELNPQYRRNIIPGNKYKKYPLRLPMKYTGTFITKADEIYKYKDSIFLTGQNIVMTPARRGKYRRGKRYKRGKRKYNYTSYRFKPTSIKGKRKLYYTVKSGDNYGFISSWYNVRVRDLKYWNNTYSNRLRLGQKLLVYVPVNKYKYYRGINKLTFNQKQALKGVKIGKKSKILFAYNKPDDKRFVWYRIRSGENLWVIAKKFPGVSGSDIKKLNRFSRRDLTTLKTGQYIKIKRK